jgi:hypothetical protein
MANKLPKNWMNGLKKKIKQNNRAFVSIYAFRFERWKIAHAFIGTTFC